MKSEKLVSLASAHGVDLLAAARVGSNPALKDTITQTKRKIRSTQLKIPPKNGAKGTPDRSVLRPTWTLAELGQAAQGVPEIPFMAACFAYAGDKSNYWRLHAVLYERALQLAAAKNWPYQLRDLHGIMAPYLSHLAVLVLDFDSNQQIFKTHPQMYAIELRITDRTWEKYGQGPFEDLHLVWLGWLRTAASIMQPRLSEFEELVEPL